MTSRRKKKRSKSDWSLNICKMSSRTGQLAKKRIKDERLTIIHKTPLEKKNSPCKKAPYLFMLVLYILSLVSMHDLPYFLFYLYILFWTSQVFMIVISHKSDELSQVKCFLSLFFLCLFKPLIIRTVCHPLMSQNA